MERIEAAIGEVVHDITRRNKSPLEGGADSDQLRLRICEFCVLDLVHDLLRSGRRCTQRSVYYRLKKFLRNQGECERVVRRVCARLGLPRHRLNLMASARGLLAGRILFRLNGGERADLRTSRSACSVSAEWILALDAAAAMAQDGAASAAPAAAPESLAGVKSADVELEVRSDGLFILVVEKESVFRHLVAEERAPERLRCICVTGRGMPDVATRACVSALHLLLRVPVLVLTDMNPWGAAIYLAYQRPSRAMREDTERTAVPNARWIGVRASQLPAVPELDEARSTEPLTAADRAKAASMRQALGGGGPVDALLHRELEAMLDLGRKCEIEALMDVREDFLTAEFLPERVAEAEGAGPAV